MKPRIIVDIDGVFANFIDTSLDLIHKITGRPRASHDDIDSHRLEESLSLSVDETREWVKRLCEPRMCFSLQPYPGAGVVVDALHQIGTVFAVTQPFADSPTWDYERRLWCKAALNIPHERVLQLHSSVKYLVPADFFVEDKLSTLLAWHKAHPGGVPILLRRKYNEREPGFADFETSGTGLVVDTLPEIPNLIAGLWRARMAQS